ncbi:MAG: cytochrome c oxidase subunit II [Acidimicrobiia bacterium]|nr:cytochrome c oxidase subunit II [Acidimicrobiia bacterium]
MVKRSQMMRRRLVLLFAILGLALASCSGSGDQSALDPKGPIARDIDNLWLLVFWISVVVFVLVEVALLYAIRKFRERPDEDFRPKQIHGNTRLEVLWTAIPAVILAVIAVPTVAGVFNVREIPEGPDVLEVEVIGHQWWFEFRYPAYTNAAGEPLTTASVLHIPEDVKVNLIMTSADVIHSFWVPALNGKRDLVPGNTSNLTLIADDPTPSDDPLPGQCAEYCWLAHADMRFKVDVDTQAEFDAWVAEQLEPVVVPTSGPELEGWETFQSVCTACHQATVQQPDGTVETIGVSLAPNLGHFWGRGVFAGAKYEITDDLMAQWLDNPSDLKPMDPDRNDIANGRVLGMPDFGLDGTQIDGLIALLKSWE